jgi:glycosyltransferase involved in cell wall biosynthesis
MTGRPFISVVMPVRNGGATFRLALESALQQDCDDYEVVVVENCSEDSTPEIIRSCNDPRVRVVQTEMPLAMPDNWEFAWKQARGDYVLYLCADDALLPSALSRLSRVIKERSPDLTSWEYAFYYHPDWHTAAERNTLRIIPNSGDVADETTDDLREHVYGFREPKWAPRMLNCCFRHDHPRTRGCRMVPLYRSE